MVFGFDNMTDSSDNSLFESVNNGVSVYSAGNNANFYIHEGVYQEYIENKIANERKLAGMLREVIPMAESMVVIQEAKFSDTVKSKWTKFINFIKGIASKFFESMSALLLDEKDYLEKYRDIILKKKPKDDMEYSYTGDYEVGINRLIKMEVPIFSLEYQNELEEDGDGSIVNRLMQKAGLQFNYNDGESLAEQFKDFFLGIDTGKQSQGKFSQLNMTDLYNFCYNYKQIEKIGNTDIKHLEQSTNAIKLAIDNELKKNGATEQVNPNPTTNPVTGNGTGSGNSGGNGSGQPAESAIINTRLNPINELEITTTSTNTNAANQTSSYSRDDAKEVSNDAKTAAAATANNLKNGESESLEDFEKKLNNIADKWLRVCRALITSKFTAAQQIAKDYMDIIRAHVRSYGGQDLKNKNDDKAPQQGTNYGNKNNKKPEQPAKTPPNNEEVNQGGNGEGQGGNGAGKGQNL